MCLGTKGVITKTKLTATIDLDVMKHLENTRGTYPLSTYVNAILRNAMNGEPVEC